jgi:predicted RNA-binding protein YlxR (DUF448 family)
VTATAMKTPENNARAHARTCVGCGVADDPEGLVRMVVEGDEIAFDLAGKSFGRGAWVHARPACLAKAPRGLGRSFRRPADDRGGRKDGGRDAGGRDAGGRDAGGRIDASHLGDRLVAACDARMAGLMLAARRIRAIEVGAEAALRALAADPRALAVVAVDAGSVATSPGVMRAAGQGRAIAWNTKIDLGALLGAETVAICAVCHESIAGQLLATRAARDAGVAAGVGSRGSVDEVSKGEGTECSRRPEGR